MKIENKGFANIFKSVRKFYGLQQSEVALILEVTQGWISKLESGKLVPDIIIWFKFTKAFGISDPYCFTYGGVEFKNKILEEKLNSPSKILRGYSFDKENIFLTVRVLKPLIDIFEKNHAKTFYEYLEKHSIPVEFFILLNHPLNYDLVDIVFNFARDLKISEKSLPSMRFDFSSSIRSLNESNVDDIIQSNVLASNEVKYHFKKGEYVASLNLNSLEKIKYLKASNLILHYNLIYPFLCFKSLKSDMVNSPLVKYSKKEGEWAISYAS